MKHAKKASLPFCGKRSEGRKLYGYIPLMANSSAYQIGALNAESFCERVLRCAGHILTEGNTLLGDEKLEKLVILRMNRRFMVFMREHYKDLIKDELDKRFGSPVSTLLKDKVASSAAGSSAANSSAAGSGAAGSSANQEM